jgi:peptidoglycan LD-endopeptidase LytH
MIIKRLKNYGLKILLLIILVGLLFPSKLQIPVKKASKNDWNRESFWYYPWGNKGVHKGIDIFAQVGTEVLSPVYGLIISTQKTNNGGNIVYILGPKWRVYYFAHLDTILVKAPAPVKAGTIIARVGTSGNAINKQPHLHFSIFTLLPYFWLYDRSLPKGYLKMFYLNPDNYFTY